MKKPVKKYPVGRMLHLGEILQYLDENHNIDISEYMGYLREYNFFNDDENPHGEQWLDLIELQDGRKIPQSIKNVSKLIYNEFSDCIEDDDGYLQVWIS